jgi:RNA polymerase sigma-70 factor (ECF subfamily)
MTPSSFPEPVAPKGPPGPTGETDSSAAARRVSPAQAERFQRLVWPYLPLVVRTAGYLCRDQVLAEDLAQETMLKALRAIDRFREGTDLKAWLLSILRNVVIDAARANRRRQRDVSLDDLVELSEPEDTATGQTPQQPEFWSDPQRMLDEVSDPQLIAALRSLPAEMRWTILLVDVEQLDNATAAEILAVPVGTVKSRAHRGRALLRDRLRHTMRGKPSA